MSDQQKRFRITHIKENSPDGNGELKYLAIVSFAVNLQDMEKATVFREYQQGKEWKKSYIAEIDGPCQVEVKSAFLKQTHDGKRVFLQIQHLLLPRELADEIAAAAFEALEEKKAATAAAGTGTGKRGGK